jgi:orotidine-5'-phosphate decarboxylase
MLIRLDWSDYSPQKVKELKKKGHKVFLDVNLWDIPNTMERALESLKKVGVDYVSILENGNKVLKNL